MVEIRQAVENALQFMRDIYEEGELEKLGLEEVEHDTESGDWLVTVGIGGAEPASTMSVVAGTGVDRHYKIIRIDAGSGAVISMKSTPG